MSQKFLWLIEFEKEKNKTGTTSFYVPLHVVLVNVSDSGLILLSLLFLPTKELSHLDLEALTGRYRGCEDIYSSHFIQTEIWG